jgi:hypothetical protein
MEFCFFLLLLLLFIAKQAVFELSGGCHVIITSDKAANLNYKCLAFTAFSSESSFMYTTPSVTKDVGF